MDWNILNSPKVIKIISSSFYGVFIFDVKQKYVLTSELPTQMKFFGNNNFLRIFANKV